MRVHVLGLGAIGTLLTHHLRRNAVLREKALHDRLVSGKRVLPQFDPSIPKVVNEALAASQPLAAEYSLTLHLKSLPLAERFQGTRLELRGVGDLQQGYRIEVADYGQYDPARPAGYADNVDEGLLGPTLSSRLKAMRGSVPYGPSLATANNARADPDIIDSLIVTTKADATVHALKTLAPRLNAQSTVVLLQNGMGIVEQVIDHHFPDPTTRPHFILGNLTHGATIQGPFHVVHAGLGSMPLAIVPSERLASEVTVTPQEAYEDPAAAAKLSSLDLDKSLPAQRTDLATLRATLLHLLALPLDVRWEPWARYNVTALKKLAANACINPVTALYRIRNGRIDEMWDNELHTTFWDICHEASAVFLALYGQSLPAEGERADQPPPPLSPFAEHPLPHERFTAYDVLTHVPLSSSSSTTPPPIDKALLPEALYYHARGIVRSTSRNYSSMFRDIHGASMALDEEGNLKSDLTRYHARAATEVEYINGYISRLGKAFGIPTPANDDMVRKVHDLEKQAREWMKLADAQRLEQRQRQGQKDSMAVGAQVGQQAKWS